MYDSSKAMLDIAASKSCEIDTEILVGDEELLLFNENYFDAVISNLSLHWTNDLPGVFIQVR